MEMLEILNDVARSRQELADLAMTENVDPAKLQFCDVCLSSLENEIDATLYGPWIPQDFPGCQAAIIGTLQRIEETEDLIIAAGPVVLVNKEPDALIRFNVALLSLQTLRFQLEVLFVVAARLYESPMQLN